MKRKIIFIVLALVVIAGLIGAYLYFNPNPDITQGKPDVSVQAKELIAAFDNDTAAARRQFVDKIIEVTGNVKKIDSANAIVLGEEGSPSDVIIGLDRRHLDDYKKVEIGKTATLQGVCSNYEKKTNNNPDDLIGSLGGTIVKFRSAGVKSKQ
jgi:hypothetical protein